MRYRQSRGAVFVLTLTVFLTASAVFHAETTRFFSHKAHIEEYGAECANCHEMEADPPAVKSNACEPCHDGTVGKERARVRARRSSDLVFSHAVHTNVALCVDCHEATAKDRQKKNRPMQRYERCASCHKENGISLPPFQCTACHAATNRNVRPQSHKKSWMLRHGKIGEWQNERGHADNCRLCHSKTSCKTCHMTMKPKSHTGLWRIRTHGLQASMDKDRCKTCHETGTCISCHRNTAPQNHRGAWSRVHGLAAQAAPERCRVCHSAAYGTSAACVGCHGGRQ